MKNKGLHISADILKIFILITLAVSTLGNGFVFVSQLALPVIAFLIVEGFLYTIDVRVYIFRMFILCLLSEVPYAMYVSKEEWQTQILGPTHNPAFATLIALVMVLAMNAARLLLPIVLREMMSFIILLIGAALSILAGTNNEINGWSGSYIVLSVGVMYLFYLKPVIKNLLLIIISVALGFYFAPLSLILLYFYNEKRSDFINKYVYYAAYPLLLLISAYCF